MKNKTLSFLIGNFIGFLIISASILTEKELINIDIDVLLFLIGPVLIMVKTIKPYLFMYSATLVYWGLITLLFNSITSKPKKFIFVISLVGIHLISAYFFNRVFGIKL